MNLLSKFRTYYSQQKIVNKFTILLLIVLLGGVIASGVFLWQVLQTQAQNEITSQGLLLTETMNSVRSYTSENIRPLLENEMMTSDIFISETVPAFSAREVFERFRQDEKYQNFYYTEASVNPTNPKNQADDYELGLLEQMENDPSIEQLTGYRTLFGQEVFYTARPMRIGSESCLVCHGVVSEAPQNLIDTYGDQHGFGWDMGDIIAAQIIYVPAQDVLNIAERSFLGILGIFAISIAAVFLTINILLRRFVISPIEVMGGLAHDLSLDQDVSQDLNEENMIGITKRGDELGELARVFKRMANEVITRTKKLKDQLRSLQIEIDAIKRNEEVEEVTGTEFFKNLESKAKTYKKRRNGE